MTVARVMKDLADDGYLVVKRGVGTFTNAKNNNVIKDSKVFGFIIGDGKYTFFDRIELMFFSTFADAVLRHSQHNWVQNCNLSGPLISADIELAHNNFDGVVWILPPDSVIPVIKRLKSSGMPVVCIGRQLNEVSSFYVDYTSLGYQIANMMLRQKLRRILLVLMANSFQRQETATQGYERAFRESGIEFNPALVIVGSDDGQKNFRRTLECVKPDGIIFFDSIRPYWSALKTCADSITNCLVYSQSWELRDDINFHGYIGEPELAKLADAVPHCLAEQISQGEDASIVNGTISFKINVI